jgi:uncharacterized protein (DUF2062 family)
MNRTHVDLPAVLWLPALFVWAVGALIFALAVALVFVARALALLAVYVRERRSEARLG